MKRIVIKIGTSTLTHDTGKLNLKLIEKYARVMADLHNSGYEVVFVTSGAIAVGISKLRIERPTDTAGKQAVAAVGQSELMSIYDSFFNDYGCQIGQILLTKDVMINDARRQNVTNTFNTLLKMGCIPVVNENDSVEVAEIKFGDNDTLSAIVADCIKADLLILLTDIDALYDGDPRKNPNAKKIDVVETLSADIENLAGDAGSDRGTGGMATKIAAAKIATEKGITVAIGNGKDPDIIYDFIDGKNPGTIFKAKGVAL